MGKHLEQALAVVATSILNFLLAAVFGLLVAVPLYYLWNWLVPDLFGLKAIDYWQAWGFYLLAAILFKG